MTKRNPLQQLYSVEYEHPFDRKALDKLENTPGLELFTKKVLDKGLEKYLRIKHTGNNIRIHEKNIPEIHSLLVEAVNILGIPEVPELYIYLEDKIQSFSSGQNQQVIVLSSGAIDLLNEEELFFLIGRELGHIKSNHVVYHMMAYSIQTVAQIISDISLGVGNIISMPLQVALLYWHRMSEFTADRAGLLACQDLDVAINALIKIAGLPEKYHGRISINDFRKQADEFNDFNESQVDKFIRFAADYENHQPFTVIRAGQLFKWVETGDYDRVLNRDTLGAVKGSSCYNCGYKVLPSHNFCRNCGAALKISTDIQLHSSDPDLPDE